MSQTYKEVPDSRGPRREFSITCGRREGYKPSCPADTHSVENAVSAIQRWQSERIGSGKPSLSGVLSEGKVIYRGVEEPCVVFSGDVNHLYNSKLSDAEVEQMLNELASRMGASLGQTRVYLAYKEEMWILQLEGSTHPTGVTV